MPGTVITSLVEVELIDFIEIAKDQSCETQKVGKEMFIGNFGARNYPHIHVWANGTIAFSKQHGRNTKIGSDGSINIDKLMDAIDRFGSDLDGGLKETIDFVLCGSN